MMTKINDDETHALIDELLHSDAHKRNSILHMSELFLQVLKPEDINISDWFNKYVKSHESSLSTSYDISLTPYFDEIAEVYLQKPKIKHINVLAPTGAGKSSFFTACLNYLTVNAPGPTICCFQTATEAANFAESRLYPTFLNNDRLKSIMPTKTTGMRKTSINFPTHNLWILGASPTQLQSKSCRYIIGDELFLWRPGMVKELLARHHDRPNRKVLLTSQGGDKYHDWHTLYNQAPIMDYAWRCTACNQFNVYKFNDLKWDNTLESIDKKADSTKMICPHCEAVYNDDIKTRRALSRNGRYINISDRDITDTVSYHINALAIFRLPWSQLVREFLTAVHKYKTINDSSLLIAFTQKRLAEFTGVADYETDEDVNKVNQINIVKDSYKLKSNINSDKLIFKALCIDTQLDHYHWSVYAYNDDNNIYLHDTGTALSDDELISIKHKYQIRSVFIDAAWDTQRVQSLCVKHNWIAINSTSKDYYELKNGKKSLYKFEYNQVNGNMIRQIYYSSQSTKDVLLNLGIEQRLRVPVDVPVAWMSQIKNEIRGTKRDTDSGKLKRNWQKINDKNNSHNLDTLSMFANALIVNGYMPSPV